MIVVCDDEGGFFVVRNVTWAVFLFCRAWVDGLVVCSYGRATKW